jgi:hypothetical protein
MEDYSSVYALKAILERAVAFPTIVYQINAILLEDNVFKKKIIKRFIDM